MANQANTKKQKKNGRRTRASLPTKILILVLLAATGWQLYRLQGQVDAARAEKEALAAQVQVQQQENDSISADIAAGNTQEKMEEIARDELGLVSPGERVFYDVSN
ncbi:Cell division protein FtsB [Oscillibacter sp. PC13]|uniref:FtsB family cell division protein n=1 Tax=Oscillibacter sp. PC13 TaxID=1855299 RepID=UPI0008EE3C8B|nr:septum formation initiator family protein [Oscillibacter sp. PC13]SFP26748.1 Cell division protein FtsB [Oscillibacter sp. PC13]